MKTARIVVKSMVVGLAAYGARELWARYQKPATEAIDDQIAPAVRDAARSVKASSTSAAHNLKESARSAVATVAESQGSDGDEPAVTDRRVAPGPGQTADDHWLSARAAAELGLDAEGHEPESLASDASPGGV
ncbi:MAG: hypothetical protein JJE46_04475 [Acidimicrobiia bacterium]|nr:hypothetical protein [Acidimicrobiia bacterium]